MTRLIWPSIFLTALAAAVCNVIGYRTAGTVLAYTAGIAFCLALAGGE